MEDGNNMKEAFELLGAAVEKMASARPLDEIDDDDERVYYLATPGLLETATQMLRDHGVPFTFPLPGEEDEEDEEDINEDGTDKAGIHGDDDGGNNSSEENEKKKKRKSSKRKVEFQDAVNEAIMLVSAAMDLQPMNRSEVCMLLGPHTAATRPASMGEALGPLLELGVRGVKYYSYEEWVVVFERMATTWLVTAREMPAEVQKAQAEPTFARRMVACDKLVEANEMTEAQEAFAGRVQRGVEIVMGQAEWDTLGRVQRAEELHNMFAWDVGGKDEAEADEYVEANKEAYGRWYSARSRKNTGRNRLLTAVRGLGPQLLLAWHMNPTTLCRHHFNEEWAVFEAAIQYMRTFEQHPLVCHQAATTQMTLSFVKYFIGDEACVRLCALIDQCPIETSWEAILLTYKDCNWVLSGAEEEEEVEMED